MSSPKAVTKHSPQIVPVIMCGGAGTRLWPVSRESMPKQFVSLIASQSTFQQVIERISDSEVFARGPAVAAASVLAAERDPEAMVLMLAADHVVRKKAEFLRVCRQAAVVAAGGHIVTFGIRPDYPATNYGYIRPGQKLDGGAALTVDAFVEKPDAATAATYVAGNYLWNSGNFLFRARVMLGEIEQFEPAMADAAKAAVAGLTRDLDFLRLAAEPFGRAPKKAIDYAVMERTKLAAVLPADIGWSDIGSWNAVWEVLDRDSDGNACDGPVMLLDSRNSLVKSDDSVLTTIVGLDDVIVIATGDAVLVAARDKAEDVKRLVERLKTQNRREAVEHRRSYRPWGYYQGIDAGARFQVKRIVVKPGGKLSLQKHFHRAEHWVVVKGTAEVTVDDKVSAVHENESVYIPIGSVHRLANPGKIPLELVEVQVGSYLGEDDIVRLDDVYGR